MLWLPDQWVWDSWVADDGDRYHLFFLQAPRSIGDPRLRHGHATVGHATSADLREWRYHGTAFAPSTGGWDDLSIWTGSVARGDDGVWRLFYTSLSTAGPTLLAQRVGIAESDDLFTWRRVGSSPAVTPDPRWYRTVGLGHDASDTWRDPFVFPDPDGDGWHMLLTAQALGGPRLRSGVLAHARSADLRHWEVAPPASAPAGFGQLEVPQARRVDGRSLLVFTCHPDEQSAEQRAVGGACTWSVLGDSLTGPWDVAAAQPFLAEPDLFAAPLVQQRDGTWVLLGFRNREGHPDFRLEILDPIPVRLEGNRLVATGPSPGRDG